MTRLLFIVTLVVLGLASIDSVPSVQAEEKKTKLLDTELVSGEGVWVSPAVALQAKRSRRLRVRVWMDRQFLGDGSAYERRAKEFGGAKRRELRTQVVATLKELAKTSRKTSGPEIERLTSDGVVNGVRWHWIINGFTCTTTLDGVEQLAKVPGVKKIFADRMLPRQSGITASPYQGVKSVESAKFDPARFKRPWYVDTLQARRTWTEWKATGRGTLNVVHDGNFVLAGNALNNVYRNPKETPGNGKDDDGNGLVDDIHGFDFQRNSGRLTVRRTQPGVFSPQVMHGTMCVAIICGDGTKERPYAMGLAPESKWAGVVAGSEIEAAVEWAIEQNADTYSMSFSIPGLGEMRSHWRKVMEHGSFCGLFFVSGAGNFAQTQPTPVQMRVPEDIPNVVFAAAGVQRDLSRTPFSSQGPVQWKTEHYQDGQIQKPEVCAFNMGLPMLLPSGQVQDSALNGNSFAGPMFCGTISLMLSADPDLLPWDLKQIITSTATDIASPGVDYQTGHGLINCYRAVKETLRRKAIRDGADPARFTGRTEGDEIDLKRLRKTLERKQLVVARIQPNGPAMKAGLRRGDRVIRLAGKPVETMEAFQSARDAASDNPLKVEVERAGKSIEVTLPPGSLGIRLGQQFEEPVFK